MKFISTHGPPVPPQVAVYSTSSMIRVLATIFAGLFGLAFGSFMNVCLYRWPKGESIVLPRSHCCHCNRTLTWWENVPLVSWLALRGRCRTCRVWIGWRYPLVELAVGVLWAVSAWQALASPLSLDSLPGSFYIAVAFMVGHAIFYWLLVALALLDAENLWLPNRLTLPGIALGFFFVVLRAALSASVPLIDKTESMKYAVAHTALNSVLGIFVAAGLILLIRWIYWLVRRREGIGLGDAKLMALLAAWLGLPGALLSFGLGVVLGALVAVVLLAIPSSPQNQSEGWAASKLPLGTFLCVGGIVSGLWGEPIIAAYMRWAGF
jgi:leader peptidase (prepilin peptidase)/N-methyltransferase